MFRILIFAGSLMLLARATNAEVEIYDGKLLINHTAPVSYLFKPDSGEPFSGIWRRWHKDFKDRFRTESTYKDGLLEGPSWRWYSNGQLELEINYKDGKKEGVVRWWFENGQFRRQTTYTKDGREEGLVRQWYANGQLKGEANLKHGYPVGLVRTWHENGQLNEEECFSNYERVDMGYCR